LPQPRVVSFLGKHFYDYYYYYYYDYYYYYFYCSFLVCFCYCYCVVVGSGVLHDWITLRWRARQIGELAALAVLNVADNGLTALPAGLANLKEKKIRDLRILPNPIADKKVLKVLTKDRVTEVVKELWKLLAASGAGGGKRGGKGKK
jgi:hypothetical protein